MVRADHSAGDWSAAGEGPLYLGEPVGFVIELEDGRRVYLRRRHRRLRRHGPDPRDAQAGRGVHADRRALHDGPGRRRASREAARRSRGGPDPLRHVPDPGRHARRAARRAAKSARASQGRRARSAASRRPSPDARARDDPAGRPGARRRARRRDLPADDVEDSHISFEEVAPDAAEMASGSRKVLAWTPWLVAEDENGRVIGYAYASRPSRARRLPLVGRHLGLRRSGRGSAAASAERCTPS